jgi:F-type H+-transporting ATPase subunit c
VGQSFDFPPDAVPLTVIKSLPNSEVRQETDNMDTQSLIAVASITIGGLTIAIGSIGPALGEGRALAEALRSIAQQPDESGTIVRTLFVGLAMIESTAIYCFVVSMILIFANPFWNQLVEQAGG